MSAAKGPIKIKKVIFTNYESYAQLFGFGFVVNNGVKDHRMDFGKVGYIGEERDVKDDRSWERFSHLRKPESAEFAKYPISILGYKFDDQIAGNPIDPVTKNFDSTSISYKEKLEDKNDYGI